MSIPGPNIILALGPLALGDHLNIMWIPFYILLIFGISPLYFDYGKRGWLGCKTEKNSPWETTSEINPIFLLSSFVGSASLISLMFIFGERSSAFGIAVILLPFVTDRSNRIKHFVALPLVIGVLINLNSFFG